MLSEVDRYVTRCLDDTKPEICLAKLGLLVVQLESLPDDAPQVWRVNLAHQISNMAALLAQREFERYSSSLEQNGSSN